MLKLPDHWNQPIVLEKLAYDSGTLTFGFWAHDMMGPLRDLGTITTSHRTLYRLLLTLREDES